MDFERLSVWFRHSDACTRDELVGLATAGLVLEHEPDQEKTASRRHPDRSVAEILEVTRLAHRHPSSELQR